MLGCRQCQPPWEKPFKRRRREQLRSVIDTLTEEQWQAILRAYKHRCAYCLRRAVYLQQEHVIPIARNGGNVAGNVVPSCWGCNLKKGVGPPPDVPLKLLLL